MASKFNLETALANLMPVAFAKYGVRKGIVLKRAKHAAHYASTSTRSIVGVHGKTHEFEAEHQASVRALRLPANAQLLAALTGPATAARKAA